MSRNPLGAIFVAGVLVAASCLGVVACSSSQEATPAPKAVSTPPDASSPVQDAASSHPDASTDTGPAQEAASPEKIGPIKRRVLCRSPFGNLDKRHRNNLLIDGDMEMSAGAGQTPWRALSNAGQATLSVATGGECRSGLRCLVLDSKTNALLGEGIEPDDGQMKFSMWARVPDGSSCDILNVLLIGGMTLQIGLIGGIRPGTPEPDEFGWCFYHGQVPKKNESVAVYIDGKKITQGQRVIVDDAVLEFAPEGQGFRHAVTVSPSERARITARLSRLRRLTPIGRVPWVPTMPPTGKPPRPFQGQL